MIEITTDRTMLFRRADTFLLAMEMDIHHKHYRRTYRAELSTPDVSVKNFPRRFLRNLNN